MKLLSSIIRLLTFRLTREEMLALDRSYFIAGLIGTWLVGMGRYWDDPGANILQHLGIGSVIYIFVLAGFIWLLVLPFKVEKWSYFTLLCFISLTSFPAIFYAIPVEQFYDIDTANTINVWFLAVVAAWRLALLFFFLIRFTRLGWGNVIALTLMPICLIISALTTLNLQRAVFDIMGGMRNSTPHDQAYAVLFSLTVISIVLTGPLVIGYIVGILIRRGELRKEKEASDQL